MAAVVFLIRTLIALYLFAVLMRLLLQWVRADFRNPLAQALIQITNPALVPLRRLFPAINRMDTASVVLVVVLVMLKVAIGPLLSGGGLPPLLSWLELSLLELITTILWIYLMVIFMYALLSMLAQNNYSPVQPMLASLCEPVLKPIRRLIPPLGGLDLSTLWAIILIQTLLILLN
jgi:YggT family protein